MKKSKKAAVPEFDMEDGEMTSSQLEQQQQQEHEQEQEQEQQQHALFEDEDDGYGSDVLARAVNEADDWEQLGSKKKKQKS